MPRIRLAAALGALAIAACDAAPARLTAPDAPNGPNALKTHEAPGGPDAAALPLGYTYTRLPIVPAGINDSDVVVGALGSDAYRYRAGSFAKLPRLAGVAGDYRATAINNRGQIAGTVGYGHALFWPASNQAPVLIVPPDPEDAAGQVIPTAVNDAGVVVGSYAHGTGGGNSVTRAFRWSAGGGFQNITPALFGWAEAHDVNRDGYVVGYGASYLTGWKVAALRWAPNGGAASWTQLDGGGTAAQAVAPNGDAVGTADYFTTARRWRLAGGPAPLTAEANSSPDDVSDSYRLVGHTYRYATSNAHRPYTVFNGATTWLQVPDLANTDNVDRLRANACGSIVGRQIYLNGVEGGLLWTKPRCDVVTPWP